MTRVDDNAPLVLIVDDDPAMRSALVRLLRSVGLDTMVYDSAQALLAAALPDTVCCLISDVRLPQIGGFELQGKLAAIGNAMPIIFITAHGDIPMSVKAMKAGAMDFLEKPFRDQTLLDAVAAALARDRTRRAEAAARTAAQARYGGLSEREKQVMSLVAAGSMNKQIAGDLGLSEITVKFHRANVMRKMGVTTLPDLVRLCEKLPRDRRPTPGGTD
ncbi:response regulator [Azorhizobium sp. AG788]|uniref:response regulator transcription factor n=1 Tax=Azorhizobium sp. AG788 TaxID=2183897 RepID=UPI003138D935